MAETKVDIKIDGDASGFVAAAGQSVTAVKGLKTAIDDGSSTSDKLVDTTHKTNVELSDLSKFGRGGSQIFHGLELASKGGKDALLGVAGAARGVVEVVKGMAGPVGIAIAATTAIFSAFFVFLKKESGESKASLESAKDAAEKLGALRMDILERELKRITLSSEGLLKSLQQVRALHKEIADAESAARKAERENDPLLTAKDKAKKNLLEERDARFAAITGKGTVAREKADIDAQKAVDLRNKDEEAFRLSAAATGIADRARDNTAELDAIKRRQHERLFGGLPDDPEQARADARRRFELEKEPEAERTEAIAAEKSLGKVRAAALDAAVEAEKAAGESAARAAEVEAAAAKELAAAQREFAAKLETIELGPLKQAMEKAAERTQEYERQMAIDLAEAERINSLLKTSGKIFVDGKEFTPPVRPNTVPRNPPPDTQIITPQERKIRDLERQSQGKPQASGVDPAIAAMLARVDSNLSRVANTLDRIDRL